MSHDNAHRVPLSVRIFKAFAVAVGVIYVLLALLTDPVPTPRNVMDGRKFAQHSPQSVMAAHAADCWTGAAPADMRGEYPGHVIWQHIDGRTVYSARLVGPALDTIFADGRLAGTPLAFCR